jgi:hypothetical protein
MNAVFQGLAMWHGLKALVAGAVVVAFLVTLGAPAQRARHQAEVKAAAAVAHCLAARPAAAHPFGRMLQRATCKLGG